MGYVIKGLDNVNNTNVGDIEPQLETGKLQAGLNIAGILLITDIILDSLRLYDNLHIWLEVGSLAGVLGLIVYLFRFAWESRKFSQTLKNKIITDEQEINRLTAELQQWQEDNRALVKKFSQRLEKQFAEWQLTEAESSVARSLLLGRSLKVIASLRRTSQVTVRQQASEVYQKSGLQGRTELSAWFLQHLL